MSWSGRSRKVFFAGSRQHSQRRWWLLGPIDVTYHHVQREVVGWASAAACGLRVRALTLLPSDTPEDRRRRRCSSCKKVLRRR